MAYIGNIPAEAYISISSQTFTTINGTGYTLSSSVESSEDIALFLNNVRQKPSTYTATGTSLTMGTATTTADELYCVYLGKALQTVNPGADSVGTSQIADLAVTAAKLASDSVETAKIKDLNVTVGKLPASVDLSTKTVTLPASVSGLGTGITNAQLAGSIDVTTKITGTVPTANLGSGTASASTFLRGDQTYAAPSVNDISWQAVTTSATLTAVAGNGYPIDTTSNACTVTLPASASTGDEIMLLDYAGTAGTNMITIDPGSLNLQGATTDLFMDVNRECVTLTYIDVTQGWLVTRGANDGESALGLPIFCDFLVLAGGGSGGEDNSGGGGAGGLRSSMTATGGGGSNESQIILTTGTVYTATVGAGYPASNNNPGSGSDSSLSGSGLTTITSDGGGECGSTTTYGGTSINGQPGGGGGGGSSQGGGGTGGAGTANQGFDGGDAGGASNWPGGGGGTGSAGDDGSTNQGGNGGNGTANSITGASVTYGGAGGGGTWTGSAGTGGTGGGGAGSSTGGVKGTDGSANLGGGGGGGGNSDNSDISSGGSGVVILRLLTSDYTSTVSGSPTVTTDGDYTVIKFTGTGTYTA